MHEIQAVLHLRDTIKVLKLGSCDICFFIANFPNVKSKEEEYLGHFMKKAKRIFTAVTKLLLKGLYSRVLGITSETLLSPKV